MPRRPVAFRIDPGLLERVDARAGELGQSRTVFVERALEQALGEVKGPPCGELAAPGPVGHLRPAGAAAPARASEPVAGWNQVRRLG